MWDWITGIAYTAHGYCLSWDPWLIALHGGSNLLIFGAYTAIPIAILIFIRRRPKLEMKGLARFFAAFIFWCGLTHLMGLVTLWLPLYDLEALIMAATAAISVATAIMIFILIPQALAIPSPRDLQLANDRLRSEISAHQATLMELQRIRDELEIRVEKRTLELTESIDHTKLLLREIAHRAGNLMSVISAMARLTVRPHQSPANFVDQFVGRIDGIGRSHNLLFKQSWLSLDFETLLRSQVEPFVEDGALAIGGPPVSVHQNAVQSLGMVFYELATNAAKYGAASTPGGRISVTWTVTKDARGADVFALEWRESGGPLVEKPEYKGWGTTVIRQMATLPLNGEAELVYAPEGLVWKLVAPMLNGMIGTPVPD
jgi:two-component sensor histidine kinase